MAKGRPVGDPRKKLCLGINEGLADKLEKLHEDTKIPKSRLIDAAVILLLEKHEGGALQLVR